VAEEEGEPLDPESWPAFVAGPADGAGPSIAHLTSLRELSLRHFREVDLRGHAPPGLETITIEVSGRVWHQLGQGRGVNAPACAPAFAGGTHQGLPPACAHGKACVPVTTLLCPPWAQCCWPFPLALTAARLTRLLAPPCSAPAPAWGSSGQRATPPPPPRPAPAPPAWGR
jgi:hypothetical protein